MKLKIGMAVVELDGTYVAVASGADGKTFNGMIRMNKTASTVLEGLKEETTEETLVDALCAAYEVSREDAARDVSALLGTLRGAGLLDE